MMNLALDIAHDHVRILPLPDPAAATAAPEAAIETRHVCVCYGSNPVVEDVTLCIPRGHITAIIGPSGCGKSSFLQALNRMTDLTPGCEVRGCVRVGDLDLSDKSFDVRGVRKHVGMIFQRPNPFPLSIRRNLELPMREHGVRDPQQLRAQVQRVLEQVGLWHEIKDRLDDSALSLSGGQQQRLCIARAIALQPRVLLMDEPCSALDPISSRVVENLILQLRGDYTILIVTHNLAQARRIADYTAFFWVRDGRGRLIEFGPTARVFDHPCDPLTRSYVQGLAG